VALVSAKLGPAVIAAHFDVSRIPETWKFPLRVLEHLSGLHSVNTEAAELKRVSVLERPPLGCLSFPLPGLLLSAPGSEATLRFNELVRLLEQNGFRLIREKGSIRYYSKPGVDRLIRVDYHGAKEIPTGTCNAILKAAGLKGR